MDNRDIELFSAMVKERQDEIRRELENEHVLRNASIPTVGARKLLFALLGVVAVATAISLWVIV